MIVNKSIILKLASSIKPARFVLTSNPACHITRIVEPFNSIQAEKKYIK
jgi:hypothetical protein